MAKKGLNRRDVGAASALCMQVMIDQVTEAAALAQSAAALIEQGRPSRAFKLALEIEPLLHEANRAMQAASLLQWRRRKM